MEGGRGRDGTSMSAREPRRLRPELEAEPDRLRLGHMDPGPGAPAAGRSSLSRPPGPRTGTGVLGRSKSYCCVRADVAI